MFVVSIVLEDVSGQIKGLVKINFFLFLKVCLTLERYSFILVTIYFIFLGPSYYYFHHDSQ